jgi:hypothetical protein
MPRPAARNDDQRTSGIRFRDRTMSRNGKSLSQDDTLYFNSFIIGLPATPAGKTIGFSNQNLVMQYGHDEAVTDGLGLIRKALWG